MCKPKCFDAGALTLQPGTASASLIWVQKRSRAHFLPMWQLFWNTFRHYKGLWNITYQHFASHLTFSHSLSSLSNALPGLLEKKSFIHYFSLECRGECVAGLNCSPSISMIGSFPDLTMCEGRGLEVRSVFCPLFENHQLGRFPFHLDRLPCMLGQRSAPDLG